VGEEVDFLCESDGVATWDCLDFVYLYVLDGLLCIRADYR
jgi:hypothetical protein